ncbi:MAG: benzoate-CoA ligase family protein [Rhodovibrionaceae bacterium]
MHSFTQPGEGFYNAACDLIGRNLDAGRGGKEAVRDETGSTSYAELGDRIDRFAAALIRLGVRQEERVLLCLLDTVDFPTAFLGAIKAGVVAVPVNSLLTAEDYRFMLRDSRARVLVVSAALLAKLEPVLADCPDLEHVIVSNGEAGGGEPGTHQDFAQLLEAETPGFQAAETKADEICFWLYTSGTTGKPKGSVHLHASMIQTAELYAQPILGIREDDVVYSAAKLFFAYGLGNGLTFPFSVGATAVLFSGRPTPDAVWDLLKREQPTIFYGVPTLFGILLADENKPAREELALRICTSAGEALPAELGKRWKAQTGVDILDGIGSTEMLHIFISNQPGDIRYGTTGKAVPGYEIRLIGDDGREVPQGELGELQIKGPSSAIMYWNQREKSRDTFQGWWTRSGDKYQQDADGYYVYCGRTDDMLKVGGIYVSPFEVEGALITHEAVLEAAVVGQADEEGLTKPKAFVVLKSGFAAADSLAEDLKSHVRSQLAPFKYPRWVEFVEELPKTATGKIQRFKLRG